MMKDNWLTTARVQEVFAEEITAANGKVANTFMDDSRLFLRSILPSVREVKPRDKIQGGVALRMIDEEICVHPYVFRQVCTNGAIRAHALQTRQITVAEFPDPPAALALLRDTIRACSQDDVFAEGAQEMRTAQERQADLALEMLAFMSSHTHSRRGAQMLMEVMKRFQKESDSSQFGLMNAITALARDTPDPEMQWELETFGGGVPVAQRTPERPLLHREELPPLSELESSVRQEFDLESRLLARAGR